MTIKHDNDAAQAEYTRLQAAYRKQGHALHQVGDLYSGQPRYYASAWGYCKPLADLREARAFLQQIGGSHADQ